MKVSKGLGAFVIIVAMAACSRPTSHSSRVSLCNTFESPEALAQGVLDALARRDVARLNALALSEAEFRELVWPELPASRPERNVPFDYAWAQMKQRSEGALEGTLGRYGGRPLAFVRTRYTGETSSYRSFAVMRESEVVAVDQTGREVVLQLFGSAMVKDGRYKLFSFVVD